MNINHCVITLVHLLLLKPEFVDAYVRDAAMRDDGLDDSGNPIWSSGNEEDPSDEFVTAMDNLTLSMRWRSKNYRIISEYSNSMSLSDSSIEQLLLLVRI